jgi:transcriptional regulator with XRE-family HTH domain
LPVIIANMAMKTPSLGMRIRRARERAKLSQEELATIVGASVRAVSDWENDRHEPRNKLALLEDALNVNLDGTPEEPEEKPTPEELNDLRDHIREVLPPDRAARWLTALDAEFGNSPKRGEVPKGAEAARSAGSARPS